MTAQSARSAYYNAAADAYIGGTRLARRLAATPRWKFWARATLADQLDVMCRAGDQARAQVNPDAADWMPLRAIIRDETGV